MPDAMQRPATEGGGTSHYYVAVGSQSVKVITLVELLKAFEETAPFGVAVCCRSRETLDAVLSGLLQGGFAASSLACLLAAVLLGLLPGNLHSDMGLRERSGVLQDYSSRLIVGTRESAMPLDALGTSPTTESLIFNEAGDVIGVQKSEPYPSQSVPYGKFADQTNAVVIAMTDVCMKTMQKDLQGLGVRVVVNYDLPSRKDAYQRRISSLLGGKGSRSSSRNTGTRAVIHMVVAGEAAQFRAIEGFASAPVQEIPVRISDMLAR